MQWKKSVFDCCGPLRAVAALEARSIPYAVIGDNAVAAWVSRIDEAAVRNTKDVDILLRANVGDDQKIHGPNSGRFRLCKSFHLMNS